MTTPIRVSIEQFLAMEETQPHLELIGGEVVPKAMPTPQHGLPAREIGSQLRTYLKRSAEGGHSRKSATRTQMNSTSICLT